MAIAIHCKYDKLVDPNIVWKTCIYNDSFEISNTGIVKRIKSRNKTNLGKLVAFRPGGSKKNYLRVSLHNKDFYVHRLVLEHFVGRPPDKFSQCSHKDGNPQNNHISNLEWASPQANSKLKISHGTSGKGEQNAMSILNDEKVKKMRDMYLRGTSAEKLSEIFKIKNPLPPIMGRSWKHIAPKENQLKKLKQIAKKWKSTSNDRKN